MKTLINRDWLVVYVENQWSDFCEFGGGGVHLLEVSVIFWNEYFDFEKEKKLTLDFTLLGLRLGITLG